MSEHRSSEFGTAMSGLVGVVLLVALVYAVTVAQFSGDGNTGTPEEISARIAPVGSVILAGAEPPAAPAAAPEAADEGPGVAIYQKSCAACHGTGAAGAPKFGDNAAWEPRMAQGLDQMLQTAIDGKGAMPPRGTCMDCTDEDLRLAIEYMLVQVGYEAADPPAAAAPQETEAVSGMEGMSAMGGMAGMGAYLYPGDQGGMSVMGATAGVNAHPSAADLPWVKGATTADQQPTMH